MNHDLRYWQRFRAWQRGEIPSPNAVRVVEHDRQQMMARAA